MTPEFAIAAKRTRESTSKVRTGCSTCKARRVKCDEAKPVCRRCAVGGRKCQYIAISAAPRSRNLITVYLPPAQSQPAVLVNDRGLDFFYKNLAADLDGQFDSKFWSKLVMQLSHSEPSIRHAVSALSIIHQDVELSLQNPAGYVNANPEAQKQWNKAVTSLSARIQADSNSSLVPLVCCLLFTCIEFLRGNAESPMFHIENGFGILAAIRRNSNPTPGVGPNISRHDLEAIEDDIVPMFSRLSVLCSLAGKVIPPMHTPVTKENSPQEDLADSRRRFIEISDTCLRFIGESIFKATKFQIDVDDFIKQIKLQTRLGTWYDQLCKLVEQRQAAGNPVKQDALNLLLVHYKTIYIWIRVCTTAGEMATDSYFTEFEELVCHAEQFTSSGGGVATPQSLSFDVHILGPLYFTAMKCRHPAIRRRAMELLRLAPRREGLWNARHAYVTAKRVIELEESHLNEHGLPDEASRLYELPLPDDESRIYNTGEMPLGFRKSDYSVVPSPAYPGMVEVVFQTRPWGLLGEWKMTKEYIKL